MLNEDILISVKSAHPGKHGLGIKHSEQQGVDNNDQQDKQDGNQAIAERAAHSHATVEASGPQGNWREHPAFRHSAARASA
jgi:hypothetical protein